MGIDLSDIAVMLGIGALLVGAFVYLYSTAKSGRQDILRLDNKDLRESNQEFRNQKASDDATIAQQVLMIEQLRDIATQTPAVTQLIEVIGRQQEQSSEQHTQVIGAITKLTGEIASVAKAINSNYPKRKDQ